ncbi:MAG TPA: DUF1570 domain-containing protein [Pirellulaceae bacterium]|nr:DUF1570 domain-containing protein [Pirellulaceae bacterium]HMO92853.1 DUF1570 domain-containing protein [Pirellulaceae bacterium]HMP69405.1 DUF1570 domain-containing protein [Pirellulaceae bacterium]
MELSLINRLFGFSVCVFSTATMLAQETGAEVAGRKLLDPKRSFGFEFDPGHVSLVRNQYVAVRDSQGKHVVGRLFCRSGDNFGVVLLPSGELNAYAIADLQITDQKFKPLTPLQLGNVIRTGDLARFNVKASKNYVFIYNTSEGFFEVTKQILESMLAGMRRKLRDDGFDIHEPEVPFAVIMFANREQFQAYSRQLTGNESIPDGILAYYNMVTNHIVLYEPASSLNTSIDVVRGRALSTIAHEGAHQILHNIGIQQRLSMWPMWISEGLAEYYAPTSFGKKFRWKGAGVINDLRMFELEHYLQSRELLGLDGSTILDSVGAARLDSTGYATAWSIVHYLAEKQPENLNRYIRYLSQLGPFYGMASHGSVVEENLEHFRQFFGEDLIETEANLISHLKSQVYHSPLAFRPHFVTTVVFKDDGGEVKKKGCIYFQRNHAEDWARAFYNSLQPSQRESAQFETVGFNTRDQAARHLYLFLK